MLFIITVLEHNQQTDCSVGNRHILPKQASENISLLVKKGILLTCQIFQLLSLITSAKIKPAASTEGLEMVIKITLTRLGFIPSEIVA